MDPWVAFGLGVLVGLLAGLSAAGLGKMAKENSEFNKDGGYECNYSSEDEMVIGKKLPSNGSTLLESSPKIFPITSNRIIDNSIYLMPIDGFDLLTRKEMDDKAKKLFGVIRFVGKDKDVEAKE